LKAAFIFAELSENELAVAPPIDATAVIQTAIRSASIIAYSTAVGPLSSARNLANLDFMDLYISFWRVDVQQVRRTAISPLTLLTFDLSREVKPKEAVVM